MTQLVAGLERAGLVRRRPDLADGRRCIVRLTSSGRALVRRARARKIAWVQAAIASLDTDQRRV
jgi:DNA-binding MarR family transcriptional regulator